MKRTIFLLITLWLGLWLGCSGVDDDKDNGKGGSGGSSKDGGNTSDAASKDNSGGSGGSGKDAGKQTDSGNSDGEPCVELGLSCTKMDCCKDLVCIHESTGAATCFTPCSTSDDCASDCCTDLKDTGEEVCAPKSACEDPCQKEGESCSDKDACCQGVCVTNTTNPDYLGCRRACKQDEDCESGCCRPLADSEDGFCTIARYCTCGTVGAKCGENENEPDCCEGTVCSSLYDDDEILCRKKCEKDGDCDSGCCSEFIEGENYGVCYDDC